MQRPSISCLIIMLFFFSFAIGQKGDDSLKLTGILELEDEAILISEYATLNIWMDGNSSLITKRILIQDKLSPFTISIPRVSDFIRLQFQAVGHKDYTKNIIVRSTKNIILGNFFLKKDISPSIENITFSWKGEEHVRYKIMIYNPLDEPILISEMSLKTNSRVGETINCNSPVGVKIQINDTLKLNQELLTGHSIDKKSNFNFEVKGTYNENHCSGLSNLSLTSPIDNIVVAPKEYASLDLFFPNALVLLNQQLDNERPLKGNNHLANKKLIITSFDYIVFKLKCTSSENYLIQKVFQK